MHFYRKFFFCENGGFLLSGSHIIGINTVIMYALLNQLKYLLANKQLLPSVNIQDICLID